MSAGLGLFQKIIKDKYKISTLQDHGISERVFNQEEKKVYNFLVKYHREYGDVPPLATVVLETGVSFPTVPNNSVDYWIDCVKKGYIRRQIVNCANRIVKTKATSDFNNNCENWIRTLHTDISSFNLIEKVYTIADIAPQVVEAHDRRQKSPEMFGIPFGIPYLDTISDGAQPGDTIAICARPELGKTMLMLTMALSAFRKAKTILYVTLEMSAFQNVRRIIAVDASVPAMRMRLGKLGHWGRKEMLSSVKRFKANKNNFYLLQGSLHTTVEDLISRVQDIQPDVLYVDGAYLLRSNLKITSKVERIAYTAETLKAIATTFLIPVIETYQFDRKVGKKSTGGLGNIGWSDVVGQLGSIVLGIADSDFLEERKTFAARQYKILEILKGREGEKGKIKMLFDMQRMKFEQAEVLSGNELLINN